MVIMETRVGGDRAKEIIDRLPFQGAIHTETIGYTWGLWLLWNTDRVEVTNLTGTEQEIHASVKVKSSNLYWLFTTVYASPRFKERHFLWNNLKYVSSVHNLPWIIAGDFNELLSSEETFGGRLVSLYRANLFKECLDSYCIADLGFQGLRFTWTNKQDITTFIQGRLDQFFVNSGWCVMYPKA